MNNIIEKIENFNKNFSKYYGENRDRVIYCSSDIYVQLKPYLNQLGVQVIEVPTIYTDKIYIVPKVKIEPVFINTKGG